MGLNESQVEIGSGKEGWTLGAALSEGSKVLPAASNHSVIEHMPGESADYSVVECMPGESAFQFWQQLSEAVHAQISCLMSQRCLQELFEALHAHMPHLSAPDPQTDRHELYPVNPSARLHSCVKCRT